jgi:hypothetical protein
MIFVHRGLRAMKIGDRLMNQNANIGPKGRARRFGLKIFALTLCVFTLMVSFPSRTLAEKKTEYTFAFYNTAMSTSDQGQIRSVFADMKKTIFERENFIVTPIYFSTEKDLLSAVKKEKVDFIFPGDDYVAYRLAMDYKFKPFINVLFLNKQGWKPCVYTKSNKNYHNVKDLKNARATIIVTPIDYIMLRHIIGEDPMEFFNSMKKAKDAYSIFYALGLDTCDVVSATDLAYSVMKKTNPGPLKGVKELACAPETFSMQGFFYSKKVPKPVIERIKAILKNAYKDDAFKKWRPLIKSFGIKFMDVSLDDYKATFQIIEDAEKRGWMKDYEKFVKSVQD